MWCDQAKWVWSWKICFFCFVLFFPHFLLGYCLGFNLVKTPQRLGNWFQRYKQLKDWTNNKKYKKFGFVWLYLKNSICEFRLILLDHITYSLFQKFPQKVAVFLLNVDIQSTCPRKCGPRKYGAMKLSVNTKFPHLRIISKKQEQFS